MSEPARVIRPIQITPDVLVYSNVPEADHPAWDEGTAYTKDEWVMHDHKIWQALRDNIGKEPGAANPNDWNDGGATNLYRMFDNKVGSQTVMVDGIEVVLESDEFIDSISVLNVFANAIRITATVDDEGIVDQRDVQLLGGDVNDWWPYFFEPVRRRTDVVIDDLPIYAGVSLRVEAFVAEGDEARIGWLAVGSRLEIGCARWGSSVSRRDYSTKETDRYGNTDVEEGPSSKRPEFDLLIDTNQVDYIMGELDKLRARPCVYIGHSKFSETIALGFYRELLMILSGPNKSECTLTIEALT